MPSSQYPQGMPTPNQYLLMLGTRYPPMPFASTQYPRAIVHAPIVQYPRILLVHSVQYPSMFPFQLTQYPPLPPITSTQHPPTPPT